MASSHPLPRETVLFRKARRAPFQRTIPSSWRRENRLIDLPSPISQQCESITSEIAFFSKAIQFPFEPLDSQGPRVHPPLDREPSFWGYDQEFHHHKALFWLCGRSNRDSPTCRKRNAPVSFVIDSWGPGQTTCASNRDRLRWQLQLSPPLWAVARAGLNFDHSPVDPTSETVAPTKKKGEKGGVPLRSVHILGSRPCQC